MNSSSRRVLSVLCVLISLVALTAQTTASAQEVPPYLVHQGRLLDALNAPVEGAQSLTFNLYAEETGGTSLWTETQTISVNGGFYSVTLGQVTALDLSAFSGATLYLGVTINSEELAPRMALRSVPYAFKARTAQNATGDLTPSSVTIGDVVIDASGVTIGGNPVIDGTGQWTGPAPSMSYNDLTELPVTLSSLTCNNGDVPQSVGGVWTCTPASSADTLSGLSCTTGQVPKRTGSGWTCSDDLDTNTTYSAGAGLTLSGTDFSVNFATTQARISTACPPGAFIASVNEDGTATCAADTNTTYSAAAGGGLTLTGSDFAIAPGGVTTARLADGAVTNPKLAADAVDSANIINGTITAADLANAAVTSAKLADAAVTNVKLAADAVSSSNIINGTIIGADIADNTIDAAKILDGTINTDDIANSAITSAKLLDGTIITIDLADGAVTGAKLLDGTIATADIADGAVTGLKLAAASVDGTKLTAGAVATANIANGAVTSAKLAAASVDGTKLTAGAVATANIADGAVTGAKLAAASVDGTKLTAGAVATANIADGAVTGAKLLDGTIAAADIADGAVTTAKILNGTILAEDLSANAVSGSNIVDGSIATADIANSAITSAKIFDGTIVAADTDPSSVQTRVTGTCAVGQTITAINANGTVTCGTATGIQHKQVNGGTITQSNVIPTTYIVEAGPAVVGRVIPIDVALTDQLCRDDDGCLLHISMVNWDQAGQPGNIATRSARLYLSQTSSWWRMDNDVDGLDGNGGIHQWAPWDCIFGDAENYTGTANGRADTVRGFGLLNVAGGSYSDATTTCRVTLID